MMNSAFWKTHSGLLDKRRLFIVLSGVLAVYVFASLQLAWPIWSIWPLLFIAYVGFVAIVWADMHGWAWVLSPLLLLMSLVAAFMWLRLYMDIGWANVIGSVGLGIGVYGLLLTLNIMHISTFRPLPLARTASSVLSLSVFITSFALYYVALYIMPSAWQWLGLVAVISWLVAWPVLWFGMKGRGVWQRSLLWSLLVALVMSQLAAVMSFWPRSFMVSVFLSGVLYLVLGIIHYQDRRQIKMDAQKQYGLIFVALMAALYVVTTWYGG